MCRTSIITGKTRTSTKKNNPKTTKGSVETTQHCLFIILIIILATLFSESVGNLRVAFTPQSRIEQNKKREKFKSACQHIKNQNALSNR